MGTLATTTLIKGWYKEDTVAGYVDATNLLSAPFSWGWCVESDSDIAQKSYEQAVKLLASQFSNAECNEIWMRNKHCMKDVQEAVELAKTRYTNSKNSKTREWLSWLSSRIMYYGAVLDTLSQHHPEYVSLAWGAMKFVFVVSKLQSTRIWIWWTEADSSITL